MLVTYEKRCTKNKKVLTMKKIYFLIFTLAGLNASAQPVFQNANERPGEAFTAAVKTGTFAAGPGNPGINQVWDFSTMVFGSTGTFIVLNTNNNLYMNNYPSANYVYIIDSGYNYFIVSGSKLEQVTRNIAAPGGPSDFSQNPKTVMEFPFSWQLQFTDTYLGYGDSTRSVTVRYDGFGTLKMPNGDYHNVARVSETHSSGVDYVWYTEDPFLPVLKYNHIGGLFTQIVTPPSSVSQLDNDQRGLSIYPNPVSSTATFDIALDNNSYAQLRIYDITGRLVLEEVATTQAATINMAAFPPGMYVCKVVLAGSTITGKFIKQ